MSRVGGKDTAPEMIVRRMIHAEGYRYRLHRKGLPGKPDLVFPGRCKALFVHGCFWHGHGCKIGRPPKSRPEYWEPKITRNRQRDAQNLAGLESLGWKVLTVWQCETKDTEALKQRIGEFLGASGGFRS